ncbi:uncharacterized protein LOC123869820 isoform X2 [Maniola jurtina]|uniref:uncharacterized protein LOC123869820 isoform X2 n=1 Tax=Maniola jurtina TaxID=191418 RepID=UPI001E6871D2|nr:uncharacterized protein LOC123869820 isoform X2 [Maniola jurtina]
MWAIVLLIFYATGSQQISITEFSVPDAVESGRDVLLQCGYELNSSETGQGLTVKWWFAPVNESDDNPIQLYQRIGGQSPEKTKIVEIEIKGNDDILLQNVTPESSGTYECEVSTIEDEKRRHDTLIVFTKGEMVLNITEVEDGPDEDDEKDILVTCVATDVAPPPDLVITVNDEELISNDTIIREGNSTFDVTTTVELSREQALGANIACELYFRNANITHEQYKISKTFDAVSTGVIGTESSFLLVISVIFINDFAFLNTVIKFILLNF